MCRHVSLILLLAISSSSPPANAGRLKARLSSLKTTIEQASPKMQLLMLTGSFVVAATLTASLSTLLKEEIAKELEREYRQREIFTRALVQGEREVVSAQLELDDFALERYLGLTVHYVKNEQHRLGVVASIDRAGNALNIAAHEDLVSPAEVKGVLLLDQEVQGRVVIFYTHDAHLLDPSKAHLFTGRVSAFGTVAGVTNGGYLLIRPYVMNEAEGVAEEPFTSSLFLVHEHSLPTTR